MNTLLEKLIFFYYDILFVFLMKNASLMATLEFMLLAFFFFFFVSFSFLIFFVIYLRKQSRSIEGN
jgi:hypothetical protein